MTEQTGNIDDTFSGVEPKVALIEPGQEDIAEGEGPDPVGGLLQGDVLLSQGIADEELAALEAEGPGIAHPTPQVMAGVSGLRELRGHRAQGGAIE